jgi:hypothetical protein
VEKWKGIMQSGFLEIPVVVTFTRLSIGVGEWFGTGITDRYWPMNQPTFETNIGTVLILKNSIRSGGKHYIEFKGSGNPRGPLAERMNKATGWRQ